MRMQQKFLSRMLILGVSTLVAKAAFCDVAATSTEQPRWPSPNAYNFYVAASAALVDKAQINRASIDKYEAGKLKTTALQELMKKNARALKLLRLGFLYEYRHPYVKSMDTEQENAYTGLSQYSDFRVLARLLILDGELQYRLGSKASAVDGDLDAMRLGIDLPRGGPYVSYLVGIACETLSRRALWGELHELDATTARKVAALLEQLAVKRVELAETLQEDKRMGIASLPEMIRRSDEENETFLVPHTQKIIKNVASWMDQTIANLRLPYALRKDVLIPIDPMSQVILPHYRTAGFYKARNLCGDALLITATALRAYHEEHRSYPTTLEQLAPIYLRAPLKTPCILRG